MTSGMKLTVWGIIFAVVLVLVFSASPFTVIQTGEVGVVTRNGAINRVLSAGFHGKTPLIEHVTKIDIQTQKEQAEADAASKDLQKVSATVAVNYNVDGTKVADLFTQIGTDYKARVIDPAIQESVKAATAQYTAEELITKRPLVTEDIRAALKERLSPYFISVGTVSIVNFDFSPQFNAAIESKVTAEQNALASKNLLEQKKYEAEQKVVTAQADAQAIRLQSDAANNEKYVQLKQLEVQLEYAKKWNGVLPVNVYGSAPIPFLQVGK